MPSDEDVNQAVATAIEWMDRDPKWKETYLAITTLQRLANKPFSNWQPEWYYLEDCARTISRLQTLRKETATVVTPS